MKSFQQVLTVSALALSLWGHLCAAQAEAVPAAAASAASSPASAAAVPAACIFEGTIPVEGKLVRTKDCYQNDGLSADDFKFLCDSMMRMASEVTSSVGTNDAKVSYAQACPAGAYARCDRFINRAAQAYFYKRSPRELEATRESCYTQGGHWNELPAASQRPVTRRKPK
jgi:hypothetical protein